MLLVPLNQACVFVSLQASLHSPSQSSLIGFCRSSTSLPQGYLWVSTGSLHESRSMFLLISPVTTECVCGELNGDSSERCSLQSYTEDSQVFGSLKGHRWQRQLQPGTAGDLLFEPKHSSPGQDRRHKSCCTLSGVRGGGESPNCHHPRKHRLCRSEGRQVSLLVLYKTHTAG